MTWRQLDIFDSLIKKSKNPINSIIPLRFVNKHTHILFNPKRLIVLFDLDQWQQQEEKKLILAKLSFDFLADHCVQIVMFISFFL